MKLSTKSIKWPVVGTGLVILGVIIATAFIFIRGSDKGKSTSFMQKSGGSKEKRLFLPSEDDTIDDVKSGLKIIKNVINVTFSHDTSSSTIKKIIESVGGEIVGYDKPVNLYQIRFADSDLATIDIIRMKLLRDFKEVELASRISVSVHYDPHYVR